MHEYYSVESSSMEDSSKSNRDGQTLAEGQSLTTAATSNDRQRKRDSNKQEGVEEKGEPPSVEEKGEESKTEMWNDFSNRFREVQSVLDRNRLLIQQVNDNHQSRTHNNMMQNVNLIQELNGNISEVVSLYSDFSSNFSILFHQDDERSNNQR